MEVLARVTDSMDWISLTILGCILAIALSRQLTSVSLSDFLSVYASSRFIKITADGRQYNYKTYLFFGVIIYALCISLLLYKIVAMNEPDAGFTTFILILTAVAAFLLFKHYLSKLIATVGNFDDLIAAIDHHRNIYRAALAFTLLVAVTAVFYIIPNQSDLIIGICWAVAAIVFVYHTIVIYSYRKQLFSSLFYFILYLCALEITPYLLLYKYVTA